MGAEAFAGCVNLDSITIPQNEILSEIKSGTFSGCSMMTTAIIPPSITYIDPHAFENCESLNIYCEDDSFAHDYAMTEGILTQSYTFE